MISIVVPMMNEEENVLPLVESVRSVMRDSDMEEWELLLVDDGSTDRTRQRIRGLAKDDPRVRLVALARNYGQSTAMQAGFDHANGDVVVTMDGDLQNDPRDIPIVVRELRKGFDIVAGYRIRRKDKLLTRKVPSWIANRIIAAVTGVAIRDNGCSLKAYRRTLIDRVRLYSDFHRFIPAMAAALAGARVAEVGVRHHPRRHGESKYGLSRIFKVLADLITIKMIRSFRLRPLRLYAAAAGVAVTLGTVTFVGFVIAYLSFQESKALSLVFPTIALAWFALAAFLLMLGLLGEVIVSDYRERGHKVDPLFQTEAR